MRRKMLESKNRYSSFQMLTAEKACEGGHTAASA